MTPDDPVTCNADRRKSCTEHGERIATLEANTATIMSGVDEIKECLLGNGKNGLKTQVDRLMQWRVRVESWKSNRFKILLVFFGGTLGFVYWVARIPIQHWFEKHL